MWPRSESSYGFDSCLEGSVRKAGKRLRINAQLIDARDGYHLWSERYDRVLEDIFEIQDDISRAILDKLKLRLGGLGQPAVQRYTVDVDAYTLYLKGRHHLHTRTPEGFRRAEDYFEQAIARDPRIAPAYAGLADRKSVPAWYGQFPAPEANAKARSLARKALEIDPELGQAHYTVGCVSCLNDWDWPEAVQQFSQGVRLNPNHAVGRCWYATLCLAPTGRIADAVIELEQATQVEPLNPIAHTFVGIGWILRRSYEDAVQSFHTALELDPNLSLAHGYLGEAYCHQHRYEEAAAELHKAQPTPPGCHFSVGLLGYCYGRGGETDDAQHLLTRLQDLSKTTYIPALSLAMTHIGMNNIDLAFECLYRAYEERYGALCWLPVEPIYDPLRSDPRFQALLRRMNFPQQP